MKLSKPLLDYSFVALALTVGLYQNWKLPEIALFGFVVYFFLNPIPRGRLMKLIPLIFFLVPAALVLNRRDRAEEIAVVAYYLVVIILGLAIYEYIHNKNSSAG